MCPVCWKALCLPIFCVMKKKKKRQWTVKYVREEIIIPKTTIMSHWWCSERNIRSVVLEYCLKGLFFLLFLSIAAATAATTATAAASSFVLIMMSAREMANSNCLEFSASKCYASQWERENEVREWNTENDYNQNWCNLETNILLLLLLLLHHPNPSTVYFFCARKKTRMKVYIKHSKIGVFR